MSKFREFFKDHQKVAVASLAVTALSALIAVAAFGQDYRNGKNSSSTEVASSITPTSANSSSYAPSPSMAPEPIVESTSMAPSGESLPLSPTPKPLLVDLTSLEPVASDAVHEVEPAVMGGVEYPEALKIECSTYDEVTMEYTLGKRYSALSGWVGIQDDASNSYATANIKFTDEKERVLARVSGPYGAPKKISNLDVRSVMRIRIHCRLSDSRKFSSQHHVTLAGMQLKSLS